MDIMLGSNSLENQDVDMDSFTNASMIRETNTADANRENSSLDNEIRDMPSSSNSCQQDQLEYSKKILRILRDKLVRNFPRRLKI